MFLAQQMRFMTVSVLNACHTSCGRQAPSAQQALGACTVLHWLQQPAAQLPSLDLQNCSIALYAVESATPDTPLLPTVDTVPQHSCKMSIKLYGRSMPIG
jgi:hypothetical protein